MTEPIVIKFIKLIQLNSRQAIGGIDMIQLSARPTLVQWQVPISRQYPIKFVWIIALCLSEPALVIGNDSK